MLAPVRRSIHHGALEEHGVPPSEHPCEYGVLNSSPGTICTGGAFVYMTLQMTLFPAGEFRPSPCRHDKGPACPVQAGFLSLNAVN